MSVVSCVLGVNEEELITHKIELLLSQESVLEKGGVLVPVDDCVVLL